MDIYLTGHLALAFGIFAKNLPFNQSSHSNQAINLYIFIIRPFFCPRSETKKNLRDFPALSFLSVLPLTIIPNTPIRDK